MPGDDDLGERDPAANAAQASAALAGTGFGPVEWVAETGSTNDDLLAAAVQGRPGGLVLVADHQLAGRGRRDHRWEAAAGAALLVSVLLRPDVEPGDPGDLGVLTATFAVAAAEACTALGCPGAQVKWPNDLVVGEPGEHRKLAGILAQSQTTPRGLAVVVGLGLNVRSTGLAQLAPEAIALDELGAPPSRVELLVVLLGLVDETLASLDRGGREQLWDRYLALSATVGTEVRVELDDGVIAGLATGVTPAGALIVATAAGPTEVVAGDLVSLRAPDAPQERLNGPIDH